MRATIAIVVALGSSVLGCGARTSLDGPPELGVDAGADTLGDAHVDAVVSVDSAAPPDTTIEVADAEPDAPPPGDAAVVGSIVEVRVERFGSCVRTSDGDVWCWGESPLGGLLRLPVPERVAGLPHATKLAVGSVGRAVLTDSHAMYGWGYVMADGVTAMTTAEPTLVTIAPPAIDVTEGDGFFCILRTDRGVSCWGDNQLNQLGVPRTRAFELAPVPLEAVHDATTIDTSSGHTCAITAAGGVVCWGLNTYRQLGRPDKSSFAPEPVAGVAGVVEVAAGGAHTCVRLADDSVSCWGANEHGQLGDGTTAWDRGTPAAVKGLPPVRQVSAGGARTCAVDHDDRVWCWGKTGKVKDALLPELAPPLPPVKQVSTSDVHTCVLLVEGGVRCWGDNVFNQLGDGTTERRDTPIEPHF